MSDKYKVISAQLDNIIHEQFAIHPLYHGINEGNVESALSQYFAMSQAFPYLLEHKKSKSYRQWTIMKI